MSKFNNFLKLITVKVNKVVSSFSTLNISTLDVENVITVSNIYLIH